MTNRYFTNSNFTLEQNPVSLFGRFVFGAAEKDTFTFAALASTADGDYFAFTDTNGLSWAVALDTTGGALQPPTGPVWTAIASARKVYYDVSGATTGSDIATLVVTALGTLVGFSTIATATASTTHVAVLEKLLGAVAAPSVHTFDDSGAGSITVAITVTGTAAVTFSNPACKGIKSATMPSVGKLTVTFGGPQLTQYDTYFKVLAVTRLWDETGNSGTAPVAPSMFMTNNSIGTANTASVTFQFTNSTGSPIATNPAAGAAVFMEFQLSNSGGY